ncbi:phage tail tape measure protein [Planococcus sp. FY231025]|uniref:phage tail tape measure protein n=1 Tax=Planococcus sp. FY231025 TaxID=3455699 RepID=UPI003F9364D9
MAAPIQGLSVSLGLDTSGLAQGLKQAKSSLRLANSEMAASMSAFAQGEKSVAKYETQIGSLSRKLDAQKAVVSAARAQFERMVATHGEGSVQAQRAATAFNTEAAAANNLERRVGSLTDEFRDFERQQQSSNSALGRLGTSLESMGSRFTSVGGGLKKAGSAMSMYITAPLAGIAVASAKTAMDFESQMSRVGAIAGATSGELEQLSQSALDLGASTSKSASEVAVAQEGLAAMGFTTQEILGAMPGVIAAAESSGADMAQTADVMASALNVFGLEASEANRVADILAQTANQSAADITDMQYALKYAGGPAAALGISLEELSGSIGLMTDAGLTGENAGTALRGALLGLLDPSEQNSKMMQKMGIAITDNEGNFVGISKLVDNLSKSMEGQTETQKAATLSSLVGKEAVSGMLALMSAGPAQIDKMTTSLENSGGASAEAAAKMKDNLKGALDELGGTFETAAITIGTILTPAIHKGSEMIQGLVEKFQNASPEAQKMVLAAGGLALALGPVALIAGQVGLAVGGVMSVVGPLATAMAGAGGLSASLGIAGTALMTFATGPVGIALAAVAGISVGVGLLANHLRKDAIPEVDRFGKGVSESTQKALTSFFELSDGASQQLTNLRVNGTQVTELMADEILTKYEDMNAQILEGMKKRHADEIKEMETQFLNSSVLTAEREAEILRQQNIRNDAQVVGQQHLEDRIQQIIETAATEKRALTESEALQIEEIQKQMNESAVLNLTQNEKDQKIILERMKNQASELSALQAAEVVKNSAKQRDEVIADADKTYNDTIAFAIQQRDETGTISAEEAQKIINEAQKKRDTVVGHAEDMHGKVVGEAKKQAEEHVDQVDWETGEILSKWDVYKNGVLKKFKDTNEQSMKDFRKWGEDYKTWSTGVQATSTAFWRGWADGVKKKFKDTNDSTMTDFRTWGQNYQTWAADVKAKANENWRQYGEGIVSRFRKTNSDSLADFKRWGGSLKEWAGDAKTSVTKTFDSLVEGAKKLPGRIGSGIKSMASSVADGVNAVSNKLASGLGKGVNGVISGINWVLNKIGSDSRVSSWVVPKYAHGTDGHPGGLAVLGDGRGSNAGRELIHTPSGDLALSPARDTLMNLPKGSQVLSAKKTKELLGKVPKYATGVGDMLGDLWKGTKNLGKKAVGAAFDVWDYVKNPKGLLNLALGALGISAPAGGTLAGNMAKAGYNKTKDAAVDYVKAKLKDFGSQNGIGFKPPFRLSSKRGMRFHPTLKRWQMHEGDDWAAPLGTSIPAQAAGTVTQSAYHSIRGRYVRVKSGNMERLYQHNSRNLVGVGDTVRPGQTLGTVGSTGRSSGPHLHYEVLKNGVHVNPYGLETGGLVSSEQMVKVGEKNREEIMIPLHPSRRTDAMKLLALAGKKILGQDKGITRPSQLPNVTGGETAMEKFMMKSIEILTQQNQLLMQILQKDANLYVDGDILAGIVAPGVDNYQGSKQSLTSMMRG